MYNCRTCTDELIVDHNWGANAAKRHDYQCRKCKCVKQKERWAANPDHYREQQRKNRAKHDEATRIRNGQTRQEWVLANAAKVKAYNRARWEATRETQLEKNKEWCRKHPEQRIWQCAKLRAKKKGFPFDIEVSDILIPSHCPALGIPLFVGKSGGIANSPSLDRLIPELGYVKGNVCIISHKANVAKNNLTPEELVRVAEWYINRVDERGDMPPTV